MEAGEELVLGTHQPEKARELKQCGDYPAVQVHRAARTRRRTYIGEDRDTQFYKAVDSMVCPYGYGESLHYGMTPYVFDFTGDPGKDYNDVYEKQIIEAGRAVLYAGGPRPVGEEIYASDRGYGFLASDCSGRQAEDQETGCRIVKRQGPDSMRRDFAEGMEEAVFGGELPAGKYDILVISGDEFAKETALLAADNLKARFREKGQFIQAWGELDTKENYRLIIDCLLNLPILYWATEVTGDGSYRECALKHLETTRKVIFRPDYSTYHTYYFDLETGKPAYGATKQGYSDESTWSRGQSWGVYGLMLNYMYEKVDGIPEEWKKVTDYFLAHLPQDKAAYWDFYFMDGPEPRDSSASAIAVCGILEAYKQGVCGEDYLEKAYEILESLAENYAAPENDEVNGILLHSTYGRLLGDGIDECCLWGDYFYMEALMRVIRPEWKPYW